MSKRVPCKFYANGACLKGENCRFSHDQKAPSKNICAFYQKGMCFYGSSCRNEHVKASQSQSPASSPSTSSHQYVVSDSVSTANPSRNSSSGVTSTPDPSKLARISGSGQLDVPEPSTVKSAARSVCVFAGPVNCPRGENCPHIHHDLCSTCEKHCLHPYNTDKRKEHMILCQKRQKELLKQFEEIECCVCLERVLSKPSEAERKFGILSECDHPFCVSCIRNWRNSSPALGFDVNTALRACPTCRKVSYFVIPSAIWYSTKEEKKDIVNNYKTKLRSIDCKHFKSGNGNCPFGNSCFYKHTVKPGSYSWIHNTPPPSHRPPRRSEVPDMDSVFDTFDPLDMVDSLRDEDMDLFGYEDFDDNLSNEHMAFLLSHMGFAESGSSSEDEFLNL